MKGEDLFNVAKDDIFFASESGRNSVPVIDQHWLEETVDRCLQILDVSSFSLEQLGKDEFLPSRGSPFLFVQLFDLLQVVV